MEAPALSSSGSLTITNSSLLSRTIRLNCCVLKLAGLTMSRTVSLCPRHIVVAD